MKNIIIKVLMLVMPLVGLAQDTYLQNDNPEAEAVAKVLVPKYRQELGIITDQALKFEKKMVEFIIRQKEIKALEITDHKKLQLLTKLSKQETAEMANVLTRPQLRYYRRLKKDYQPVLVLVEE